MATLEEKLVNAANDINNKEAKKAKKIEQSENITAKFCRFISAHPQLVIGKDGKQYLRCEAWQYLISLAGLVPSCNCITMVHRPQGEEEKFVGVKVEVELVNKQGLTIARSMMTARADEEWLKDKPEYAVYGMAQTRAISRAARNVFGWVALEAGFEAVPWEEINS